MALSWKEIKDCALKFSREWAHKASEDAEAQSFWNGFFDVFGVSPRRFANFERRVEKIDDKNGYIDLLRKGVLLVEHKSRGRRSAIGRRNARAGRAGAGDALPGSYALSGVSRRPPSFARWVHVHNRHWIPDIVSRFRND